jgi:Flp pilus assembly protein TadB
VAQTRRRRRTKHRGNAAGVIEARGRTGRQPTATEKGRPGAQTARANEQRRQERYDRPPTWRGAFYRALFAAVLLLVLAIVLKLGAAQAVIYFVFALLFYTPISYYTDMWMYRRRQRSKTRASK